ncbi:hypothetical protein, partial [Hymenobacter sp.]|uniref:hypothetical protein n=1 Tax=Hymenobacter sp. TaxID=1898978 RepID=UPI00286C47C7
NHSGHRRSEAPRGLTTTTVAREMLRCALHDRLLGLLSTHPKPSGAVLVPVAAFLGDAGG